MAGRAQQYKWCFVPCCKNTSVTTPSKLFLAVPRRHEMRREWCKMARREDDSFVAETAWFCCEDHFNLEEDTINFTRFKIMGGRLLLRKGVVPHKFECQRRGKEKSTSKRNTRMRKRAQKQETGTGERSEEPFQIISNEANSSADVGPGTADGAASQTSSALGRDPVSVHDTALLQQRSRLKLKREERQQRRQRRRIVEDLLNSPLPYPPRSPTSSKPVADPKTTSPDPAPDGPAISASASPKQNPEETESDKSDCDAPPSPGGWSSAGELPQLLQQLKNSQQQPTQTPARPDEHPKLPTYAKPVESVLISRTKELRARRLRLQELEAAYGAEQGGGGGDSSLVVLRRPTAEPGLLTRLRKHQLASSVETMPPNSLAEAADFIHQLRLQNLALREEMLKWAIKQRKVQAEKAQASEQQLQRVKTNVVKRKRLRELETIESSIRDIFTEQQVKAMSAKYTENSKLQKKVVHWREEDMRKTAELRAVSNENVVNFVRQKLRIPLPCLVTVKKKLDVYPELKELWKTADDNSAKKETRCAMCERQLDTIMSVAAGEPENVDPWGVDRPDHPQQPPSACQDLQKPARDRTKPAARRHRKRLGLGKVGPGQLPSSHQKRHRRQWRQREMSSSGEEYDAYPVPPAPRSSYSTGGLQPPLDGYQPPAHVWPPDGSGAGSPWARRRAGVQ